MFVETTRFGTVEVQDDLLLTFPEGILGFESVQEYCLLEHIPGSPFLWLQAVTNPTLAFVVINPFAFELDYDLTISDADEVFLKLESPEDVRVLSIVTINGGEVSANLIGPIVVNDRLQRARQVVLSDSRYTTRHLLVCKPATVAQREYCEVA